MDALRTSIAVVALGTFAWVLPSAAWSQQPVTLDEAILEASAANAHLPVSSLNVAIARAQLREARARRGPSVILDGDVHDGYPPRYASGDARLQAIAVDTLLDGGRIRAGITVARLHERAAGAGYRVTQKDVELNVRLQFAEAVRAQAEVAIREAGLGRLRAYLASIEARKAAGEGVAGDVLTTRVRLATEEANIVDAEGRLDAAELQLKNLMGRPLRSQLVLAPLPAPSPPSMSMQSTGTPWLRAPDVIQAQALIDVARAGIGVLRADRRPQLSIAADVGVLPTFGNSNLGSGLNNGTGAGGEVTIFFTLPIFDAGIYKARLTEARLAAEQARDSAIVVQRQSELAWTQSMELGEDLYRELQLRSHNVPIARDAYLETESLYRGGAGTTLEVLDAYTSWIDAQIAEADATLQYRQTEANLLRWGTS